MFRKFFVFFFICFFVATSAIGNLCYTAENGKTVIRTHRASKSKKTSKTSKKRTTSRITKKKTNTKTKKNRKTIKKNTKKAKSKKTRNKKNSFLDEENNFVLPEQQNDVEKNSKDSAQNVDNNQEQQSDEIKINQIKEEEKQQEKPIERKKEEEKTKSSFFDRFYVKNRIYGAYEMNSFKSPVFDNVYVVEQGLKTYKLQTNFTALSYDNLKKSNSISLGIESRLYFKFNNIFSVFGGIDLRLNQPFNYKNNPNFQLEYNPMGTRMNGGVSSTKTIDATRFKSAFEVSQYGHLSAKIGLNVDLFTKHILQFSTYGIFGINLIKTTITTPVYEHGYILDGNDSWPKESKVEVIRKNNIGTVFGGGLEIVINNIFFIGAEYTYSVNKISGRMSPDGLVKFYSDPSIPADKTSYKDMMFPVFGNFSDKIKTQTIIAKFGIQF